MTYMFTDEINKLDLSQLKNLLKNLNLYKSLVKELGQRGIKAYDKLETGKLDLSVEYYPLLKKEYVEEQSKKIFKEVFNLETEKDSIVFKESDNIKGGMRLFVEDKVLDLTYSKIEKQFS